MMLWLAEAEPQLRAIDTWNAESNDHMIARQRARSATACTGRVLEFQRSI